VASPGKGAWRDKERVNFEDDPIGEICFVAWEI
jgi:hypothetical protein